MRQFWTLILAATAAIGAEPEAPPNKPGLEITANFATFSLRSNLVFYSNEVRVVDSPARAGNPPTILTARELRAKGGTNGGLEWIIAEGDVLIDQGDRHAGAERAIYTGETEKIELTGGKPFLIVAGFTNFGSVIVYDRRNETLSIKQVITQAAAAALSKSGISETTSSTQTNGAILPRTNSSNRRLFSD